MPFFQLNWVILAVTLLFLLAFVVLEHMFRLVSEVISIKPYKLYILIILMGSLAALLNYVAVRIFGSWEMLIMFIVIAIVLILVLIFMIRRKFKSHKEKKELKTLRTEKEYREELEENLEFPEEEIIDSSNLE